MALKLALCSCRMRARSCGERGGSRDKCGGEGGWGAEVGWTGGGVHTRKFLIFFQKIEKKCFKDDPQYCFNLLNFFFDCLKFSLEFIFNLNYLRIQASTKLMQ